MRFIHAALGNNNSFSPCRTSSPVSIMPDQMAMHCNLRLAGARLSVPRQTVSPVVQGDIDLSGYRYASLNAPHPANRSVRLRRSGKAGAACWLADLNIYGSITYGFARPPVTDDDKGWLLLSGGRLTSRGAIS